MKKEATSDDEDVFNMVAGDFAACLDVDAIEKGGLAGVPEIIAQVQKLFPIEGYASNKTLAGDYEKWADALAYLNSVGVPVFGDFGTIVDVQNPESMIPAFNVISAAVDKAIPPTYDIATLPSISNATDIEALLSVLISQAAEQGTTEKLAASVLAFAKQYEGIYVAASQGASLDLDVRTHEPFASYLDREYLSGNRISYTTRQLSKKRRAPHPH